MSCSLKSKFVSLTIANFQLISNIECNADCWSVKSTKSKKAAYKLLTTDRWPSSGKKKMSLTSPRECFIKLSYATLEFPNLDYNPCLKYNNRLWRNNEFPKLVSYGHELITLKTYFDILPKSLSSMI